MFPFREPGYNLVLTGEWSDPAETDVNVAWVRETFTALEPYTAPKVYVNYLADDEGERVVNAYGPNLERLVEMKRRYDPENLFHLNENIDASTGDAAMCRGPPFGQPTSDISVRGVALASRSRRTGPTSPGSVGGLSTCGPRASSPRRCRRRGRRTR